MVKNKKLQAAEKLFDALPPALRAPDTYRAICKAAKVKDKVIEENLALAEKMTARIHKARKKKPSAFGGF